MDTALVADDDTPSGIQTVLGFVEGRAPRQQRPSLGRSTIIRMSVEERVLVVHVTGLIQGRGAARIAAQVGTFGGEHAPMQQTIVRSALIQDRIFHIEGGKVQRQITTRTRRIVG